MDDVINLEDYKIQNTKQHKICEALEKMVGKHILITEKMFTMGCQDPTNKTESLKNFEYLTDAINKTIDIFKIWERTWNVSIFDNESKKIIIDLLESNIEKIKNL